MNNKPKIGTLTLKVHPSLPEELLNRDLPEPDIKTVSISGEFSIVLISNVSHWRKDLIIDPDSRPDDGRLSVCVVRHCSRWNFLRFLIAMETGSHVSFPWVEMFKCSEIQLINETGEVNVCSIYGENELSDKRDKRDGIILKSVRGVLKIFC